MKRPAVLGALCFFSIHILLVTTPVFLSGAIGETQGWITYFADFPLMAVMLALGVMESRNNYLLLVYVLGPLMYAAVGALTGFAIGRIFGARPS